MQPPSWRRRGWLALIGGAHLLALMCWKAPERPLAASVTPHEPITYILTPFKPLRPPQPVLPPPAARAAERAARLPATRPPEVVTASPRPQAEPQPITAPAVVADADPVTLPPDPFAVPVKPQDDLKQRALKGALAADQKARKLDAWTQRDRKYVNDETALATAIGKAYKERGSAAIGEFTASDGSRVTKWRTSDGTVVCYYKASNNFAGGRDPFRDTGTVSIGDCPK